MEQPRKSKRNMARWDLDKVRFKLEKPQPPHREIRSIDTILQQVMDGLEQPQSEHILLLRDAWPKLVGPQIAKHSSPGFIKDWTLYVRVNHPGWLPEMKRNNSVIFKKVKAKYPTLPIRRMLFILDK